MSTNLEAALFHRMPFGNVVPPTSPKLDKPLSKLRTNGFQSKMIHGTKRKDFGEEKETFLETTKSKAEAVDTSYYSSRNYSSSSSRLTLPCCSELVMDIDSINLPGPCRYECGTSTKFVSRTVQYKAVERMKVRKRSRAKKQENGYSGIGTTDSLFRRLDAHVMSTTSDSEVYTQASENDSTTAESSALKAKEFGDIELISLPGPCRYECGTATKFISQSRVSKELDCNEINSTSVNSEHPNPQTPSSCHEPASRAGKLSQGFQIIGPQHKVAQVEDNTLLGIVTPEIFYEALSRLHMEHDPLKLQPKNKKRRRGYRGK